MSRGETYVFAAYLALFVVVLGWLVIHAYKIARLSRELAELVELARRRDGKAPAPDAAEARVAGQ
ncbi:MAG TPA: hypothetical protein VFO88_08140 [Gaiellaceae bacterium]|nr:hypothetical protein [Gaiellaceae bacterium]